MSAGLLRSSRFAHNRQQSSTLVRYVKPMQCGGSDERFVKHVAELDNTVASPNSAVNPYQATTLFDWETWASPHTASRNEGIPISDVQVLKALQEHFQSVDLNVSTITWYETAGGVLSPAAASPDNDKPWHARKSHVPSSSPMAWGWQPQADLYRGMASSTTVVLVGDARLGGISATLSSLESLIWRGYRVSAIVLINPANATDVHANACALRECHGYNDNPPIKVVDLPAIPPDPLVPLDDWYQSEAVTQKFDDLNSFLSKDWLQYMERTKALDEIVVANPALPEASLSLTIARKVSQMGTSGLKGASAQQALTDKLLAKEYSWASQNSLWIPKTAANVSMARKRAETWALQTYQKRMRVTPERKENMEWAVCRHNATTLSHGDNGADGDEDGDYDEEEGRKNNFTWISAKDLVLDAPTLAYSDGKLKLRFPEGFDVSPDTVTEFESTDKALDLAIRRISPKLYSQYKELIEMQWLVYEHSGVNRKIGAILLEPFLSWDRRWIDPLWQRALIAIGEARNIPVIFDQTSLELSQWNVQEMMGVEPDVAILGGGSSVDGAVPIMTCVYSQEVGEARVEDDSEEKVDAEETQNEANIIDCICLEHHMHLTDILRGRNGPTSVFPEDAVQRLSKLDQVGECFALGNLACVDVKGGIDEELEKITTKLATRVTNLDVSVSLNGCRILLEAHPFLGRDERRSVLASLEAVLQ